MSDESNRGRKEGSPHRPEESGAERPQKTGRLQRCWSWAACSQAQPWAILALRTGEKVRDQEEGGGVPLCYLPPLGCTGLSAPPAGWRTQGAAWLAEPMSVVLKGTPGEEMEVEPVSALGSPRGCGRRPTHGACPGL